MNTAASAAPAIEPSALATIAELDPGGQAGLVGRIVKLFVEDSAKQLQDLRAALDARDAPLARRIVHTVKSSGANVGAMELSRQCAAAEAQAAAGALAEVEAAYPRLLALREAAVAELVLMQAGQGA